MPLYCQGFMYTQYVLLYLQRSISKFYSQNINSPSGAICTVFDNFFLRLIRIMKFSEINTLYLFIFLRTNNCAVISLELLTVMNINLNGNTGGSFPIVSNIYSRKSSENFPYVLTIFPSSCNAQ